MKKKSYTVAVTGFGERSLSFDLLYLTRWPEEKRERGLSDLGMGLDIDPGEFLVWARLAMESRARRLFRSIFKKSLRYHLGKNESFLRNLEGRSLDVYSGGAYMFECLHKLSGSRLARHFQRRSKTFLVVREICRYINS